MNESYPQDQEGGRYLQKTIQSQQHQQQSSFHRGLTVKDIGRFQLDEIGVENIPWEDQSEIQRYIREQRQVYYWVVNENNFYQYQAGL